MVQRSLSERISLVVQDAIYKVADDLTTVVDEALEAFEDAAKMVEEKVTPAYTVVVNGSVDPESLTKHITDLFGGKAAEQSPSQTGGREITNPTLEETLAVVYDYLVENVSESEIGRISKARALEGSRSTIAREFKTHVWKSILGRQYTPESEKVV